MIPPGIRPINLTGIVVRALHASPRRDFRAKGTETKYRADEAAG
jgi:hypothetical protein